MPYAQRLMGWRPVAALLGAMLSVVGCDEVPVASRLGVVRVEDDVEVRFLACREEQVTEVALINSHGELGDDDDDVLWLIESKGGSDQEVFVLAETPDGFEEKVSLRGEVPESTLTTQVRTSDGLETAVAFETSTLKNDAIHTVDGDLDPAAFDGAAEDSC